MGIARCQGVTEVLDGHYTNKVVRMGGLLRCVRLFVVQNLLSDYSVRECLKNGHHNVVA